MGRDGIEGPRHERVEAITVCIGYGDFLAETARVNRHLVDDLVVITAPEDAASREVCRLHSLRHVLTQDHRRGGSFNKGRVIQRAIDQLGARDWILHLDADVVLPRSFRLMLELAHLDPRCIYGADRINVMGYEAWTAIKARGGWDNHSHGCYQRWCRPHQPGSRWVSHLHGYCPIGAFQLWHGATATHKGIHQRIYPAHHADAARSDTQFALQWDRRDRRLLAEVIVLHLESEDAGMGANWAGRKTKPFGPASPAGGDRPR